VLTRTNNRDCIEELSAKDPQQNVHWVYFDLPLWMRFWKRNGRGVRMYYFFWQLGAYFVSRRLHRQVRFDLAHHLTFGTYWMPSLLALLPITFVWGPLGGAESVPPHFWSSFSFRGKLYELLRDAVRTIADLNPLVRLNARRAAVVLCKSEETKKHLEALACRRAVLCSEVALSVDEIHQLTALAPKPGDIFRLISIGRLIHWKGFELGLRAFAIFHTLVPDSRYWFIGDGHERRRLQGLANQLGVADSVEFLGKLRRAEVLDKLLLCDVLVHPSLHDSGGWVCVEAMASGRPVICLDVGGPAVQVDNQSGIKVRATSPQQVIHELANAMQQLALDQRQRQLLGKGAQARVQECFRWDNKSEWVNHAYCSAKYPSG
jgi:glycosyltransferase involved in cell wall biosynthesis